MLIRNIAKEEEFLFMESTIDLHVIYKLIVDALKDSFYRDHFIILRVWILGSRLSVIEDDAPLCVLWHLIVLFKIINKCR